MKEIIKIDLNNDDEVDLLNLSAIARKLGVSPQHAGRVLRKKKPSKKLKERIIKLFGMNNHQAA